MPALNFIRAMHKLVHEGIKNGWEFSSPIPEINKTSYELGQAQPQLDIYIAKAKFTEKRMPNIDNMIMTNIII